MKPLCIVTYQMSWSSDKHFVSRLWTLLFQTISSRPNENSMTLTQIMRVKAWARTAEDAQSNSLHTLFIMLSISLSRESPEEENKPSQLLLTAAQQKAGGEFKDTNWPCGLLLTRPAKHFAAEVYDSWWLQVQLISSSCDSSWSIWGTFTWRTAPNTQNIAPVIN